MQVLTYRASAKTGGGETRQLSRKEGGKVVVFINVVLFAQDFSCLVAHLMVEALFIPIFCSAILAKPFIVSDLSREK